MSTCENRDLTIAKQHRLVTDIGRSCAASIASDILRTSADIDHDSYIPTLGITLGQALLYRVLNGHHGSSHGHSSTIKGVASTSTTGATATVVEKKTCVQTPNTTELQTPKKRKRQKMLKVKRKMYCEDVNAIDTPDLLM